MEARDFRSLGRPAQEALRRRALFLIAEEGMSQGEAARAVGVHRQTVNIWLKRYREQGEEGVLDGRRVSPRRGQGRLPEDEARQARRWITGTTLDQQGLPWALWTRRAVQALIEWRLGKRLGLTTVQLYLQPTPAGWPAGDPGTLGDEPAKAPGSRQGALSSRDPEVAGDHLSGDRQTCQGRTGDDLLG